MKSLPILKLFVMIALTAWMYFLAAPAKANTQVLADSVAAGAPNANGMGVPETSSVVLIGALGVTLMLRRRRLHA